MKYLQRSLFQIIKKRIPQNIHNLLLKMNNKKIKEKEGSQPMFQKVRAPQSSQKKIHLKEGVMYLNKLNFKLKFNRKIKSQKSKKYKMSKKVNKMRHTVVFWI